MIGRIAVQPAQRGIAWRSRPRRWRMRVWWRVALARSDEKTPVGQSLKPDASVPYDRANGSPPGAAPHPHATVDALYQRHARAVLGYLTQRLPTLADAEDALGEVFVAALQSYATGVVPDLSWLLLVARRRAADFYRARARGGHLTSAEETAATAALVDPSTQPETLSLRAEAARELRALIATLPDEQREVLALRFATGLRAAQIGALLGKREDAVRALLSRAVRRLRAQWNQEASR